MKSLKEHIKLIERDPWANSGAPASKAQGSDLEVPDTVADYPAIINTPNGDVVGYTQVNRDKKQDASLVQKWLNDAGGYNLKVDGIWGPKTSSAMGDMMSRAISGEFKNKIPEPKTQELPSEPGMSATDALRLRLQKQKDMKKADSRLRQNRRSY